MIPEWLLNPLAQVKQTIHSSAQLRQNQLTKPPGSLGELENIAIKLATLQQQETPTVDKAYIAIFAGDHGIAEEGVSAFPQAVTAQMIRNFAQGGAAISVLARAQNATLEVINTGTLNPMEPLTGVVDKRIGPGTANFSKQPAMEVQQLYQALTIGHELISHHKESIDIFIGGEMGIGNSTAASALLCTLLDLPAKEIAGPGTGLNAAAITRKAQIIDDAIKTSNNTLKRNAQNLYSNYDLLQYFGGFEIAALTGAYITCAQNGIAVLIDGFITTVAALLADKISPGSAEWFLYGHTSAEPGHPLALEVLDAKPLLNLNMRLGEASGAAVALPILKLACATHNQMATFDEAGVSNQ